MRTAKVQKPNKPYPNFPQTSHPGGQWCKKIRGKVIYFGAWGDPDAAIRRFVAEKDDWYAGVNPRKVVAAPEEGHTLGFVVDCFLDFKRKQVTNGDLSVRSFADYEVAGEKIVEFFGEDIAVEKMRAAHWSNYHDSLPAVAPSTRSNRSLSGCSSERFSHERS